MASIEIHGNNHTVTLSEPDGDGCYTWHCSCGHGDGGPRPITDAIAGGNEHIDYWEGERE